MADLLFRWPQSARFGRRVPKEKFYEHTRVSASVKEKFVSEVARITWAYKLAETTINLPSTREIPEIQIFEVAARGSDVSEQVLATIDRAIPSPIIFEITREPSDTKQIRMAATQQHLAAGIRKPASYFTTNWLDVATERAPLPTAINLSGLYTALLEPLTEVQVRAGETVAAVADRLSTISKLEREISALERKIRNEPQFNRKVELRRTLTSKQALLEEQR